MGMDELQIGAGTPAVFPEIDLLVDVANSAPKDKLEAIQALAEELKTLDLRILKGEAYLKVLKETRLRIASQDLPDALAAVSMNNFGLTDGSGIEVNPFVSCSIPSKTAIAGEKDPGLRAAMIARREQGFKWLEDNKSKDLIKSCVSIDFERGGNLNGLLQMLKRWTKLVKHVEVEETVHPSTLKSFVTKRIEAGLPTPVDVFAITTGRIAKIVPPKTNK